MLIAFASAFTFPTQASPVRRVLQFIFVNALTSRTPLKYYCAMTCWYLQPPPLSVVFASSLALLLLKIVKHLSVLTFLFYSSFVNCYIFRNKWYNAFQPIGQFPGQDNWKIHPNIDNKKLSVLDSFCSYFLSSSWQSCSPRSWRWTSLRTLSGPI